MNLATRTPRRRWRTLLMTGAGACLVVLISQCRLVDDSVLSPTSALSESAHNRSRECIHECKDAYDEAMKAEDDLHAKNLNACGRDHECKRRERDRHHDATQRIKAERRKCIDACHHQGGGSGGR